MRILMKLAVAVALASAAAAPAYAVDNTKTAKQTKNIKKPPSTGGTVIGGGNGVAELSAQDCRNVGGTVVHVGDDRCGSTHKYCRMPDTNAVCIDIKGD